MRAERMSVAAAGQRFVERRAPLLDGGPVAPGSSLRSSQ
jgi:hypothetical protein